MPLDLHVTIDPEDFQLNVCPSLANTKTTVASMVCKKGLSWGRIASYLYNRYMAPCKKDSENLDIKDTFGFNINHFNFLKKCDIIKILTETANGLTNSLEVKENSEKTKFINKFKLSKIDTLPKREAIVEAIYKNTNTQDYNSGASLRRKENLDKEGIRSLYLDFDNDKPPYCMPTRIVRLLNELDVNYVAYSSFSSTPEKPKFRVLIPYSVPTNKWWHEKVSEFILLILDSTRYEDIKNYRIDLTCLQPIRFFYTPNVPSGFIKTTDNAPHDDAPWFCNHITGKFLDPNKVLKEHHMCVHFKKIDIHSTALIKKILKEQNKKVKL
jgi:hypothetical protein